MINIDALNDDEKLAALESIHKSIAESKEIQKKKITTNVELIVKALKKIESDLQKRYDETGQLIANLKNGEDGRDGKDGKDGKNGRDGRDGPVGPRGYDGVAGRNGLDGADGVSVTDAHIDFDGSLIIHLSSGRVINVGEVVAADIAEKIKVITNGGGTSQSVLDAIASLQAQIDAIASGLEYQGTWNASTNVPTLTSSVGTAGYYYIVATAGSTNLNGVTDWQVGDWAVFNGSVWQKIDQTNLVTSVAGRTGAIVLTTADIGGLGTIATQAANNVSITGGSITGITDLAIADGGTGQSSAAAAITALTGTQTSGYYLRSNGTNSVLAAIVAADVPTLNQSTTGSAATLSLTNPVSRGGTNLTSLTNKGVLYASSTSQVATGTALQFDGTNFGVGATPSAFGSTFRAVEVGDLASLAFESNGSAKKTYLSTNAYNATNTGARPYYKANGLATEYSQNVGEHAWFTAPTGIAGSSTTITTGKVYTNLTAGNQADFGAANGLVGTIWTATSSGTLTTGTVVQNIDFVESMRIDASSNVGIGISSPGSKLDVKGTLRLSGSTSGYVGLAPAAAAGSTTYTLPSADGTSGQSLTTNGSGALSWASTASGTVTSVAASVPTFLSIGGSPITTSGTLAITLSGTALPTTSGGTGLTSFTSGGVVYASSTSALATGSALVFDGTNFGVGTNSSLSLITGYSATSAVLSLDGDGLTNVRASRYSSDSTNGNFTLRKSRGTFASPTAVNSSDGVGTIQFLGYGGTNYRSIASLQAIVDTYTSDTNISGILSFALNVGSTTATEQMRLTSTGLGIGTSSPSYKLDVNGIAQFRDDIRFSTSNSSIGYTNPLRFVEIGVATTMTLSSGNLGLGVTPSAWGDFTALQFGETGCVASNAFSSANTQTFFGNNVYYNAGYKYIATGSAAAQYIQIGSEHRWSTAASGTAGDAITFTQAMTLDADGDLGIGTTSPRSKLDVNGNAYIGASGASVSVILGGDASTTGGFVYEDQNQMIISQITAAPIIFRTTNTERMRLDSSGNLGVGTTSPNFESGTGKGLQVNYSGGLGAHLKLTDSASGSGATDGFDLYAYNTNGYVENYEAGAIVFRNNGSERARIDSSGNLLVGATSQINGERLSVVAGATNGVYFKNTSSANYTELVWNSGTTGDNGFIAFGTEATYTGRGGITYNRAGGLVAYNTTSDYRAKDIIGSVTNSGFVIDSVPVYMGKMHGATQERPMFIAHETPDYAHTGEKDAVDADGNPVYQQMDASALIPVMWAEIQSLRKRLATLESK